MMKKFRVYVTRRIPVPGIKLLETTNEISSVEVNPHDRPLSRMELLQAVDSADAILCLLTDRIDGEIVSAAKNVRVFSNYAVGYNNIDVEAATANGILVTNTPGVLTDSTADMAFALMMAVARRIPETDQFIRQGRFSGFIFCRRWG